MLAVALSPHGFKAILTDVATLSQAHLIQRGLGTEGRTPGKILLSGAFTATHATSCRTPVVDALNTHGRRRGVGMGSHPPQERWTRDTHPQFGSESFSHFPTSGKAKGLEGFRQPISHTGIGLHQGWEAFGKDFARAIWRATDIFAHL
jgi:hypothetical protein